jgi:DNA invertase Pin-like site-specific DNA recombinase
MREHGQMRIGYARVSTNEQNFDGQLDALKNAGCEKIVSEKVSTRREVRPELLKLLEYLRPGDTLVTTKMDRVARSLKELIELVENLKDRQVDVVFLDQRIDTTTPTGKLTFHLIGAFAEFERDMIRERTLAGLEAARARGRKGGRKRILKGDKLQTAFRMYDSQDYTIRQICDFLAIKERTFYNYLARRKVQQSSHR